MYAPHGKQGRAFSNRNRYERKAQYPIEIDCGPLGEGAGVQEPHQFLAQQGKSLKVVSIRQFDGA
ncbi:hypothetical protein [Candidatus Poriferisocius sp.]|uniref:hypothetical protein n=1 Tax=Candidatus Poriferisocius sp. TaxID=3101276 RepID=UPI003B0287F4